MKTAIIRNPAAGGRGARNQFASFVQAFRTFFPDVDILETSGNTDPVRFSRGLADSGTDLIIAAGGDGTVNGVVQGVLTSSRPRTQISVIPLGSGCDFIRNFDIAVEPTALASSIARAPARRVDAVRLLLADGTVRHFANVASAGVSAMVARSVNGQATRRYMPRGLRFPLHSVREILRYRPQSFRVAVDGREIHAGPVTAAAITNGGWFGGGMQLMPTADLSDGLLDVAILRSGSRTAVLDILRRLYSGTHIDHPLVLTARGRAVEIESLDGSRLPLEVDGETGAFTGLKAELLPAALNIRL